MAGVTIAMLAKPKGLSSSMGPEGGEEEEEAPPSSKPGGGSARKLAMLAIQAIKDGDDEAAADALVGAMQACSSHGYEEE